MADRYRVDDDAVILLEVFVKKLRVTPSGVIATCRARAAAYDRAAGGHRDEDAQA